jgi:hypothetical protein
MDKSFQEKLHLFAKYALKGDEEAMRFVINILLSLGLPQTNAVAYLFVYQSIMNTYIDLKEECRKCGGVCCRFGEPVELYNFDIEDLKALSIDLSRYIFKSGDRLYLPRSPKRDYIFSYKFETSKTIYTAFLYSWAKSMEHNRVCNKRT